MHDSSWTLASSCVQGSNTISCDYFDFFFVAQLWQRGKGGWKIHGACRRDYCFLPNRISFFFKWGSITLSLTVWCLNPPPPHITTVAQSGGEQWGESHQILGYSIWSSALPCLFNKYLLQFLRTRTERLRICRWMRSISHGASCR